MNYINAKMLFESINITLSEEQFEKLTSFKETLLEKNKVMNLTAITSDEEVWLKHFIDSSTIIKYIDKNKSLIDVGTGAGFPGIPVKILRDDIDITLLDSLNKRIDFLKEVSNTINLSNIEFIHGRAEDFGQEKLYREKFDYCTARAVANLSVLAEYCVPFIKVGGKFICMKSVECTEEVKEAEPALKKLGCVIEKIDEFILPGSSIKRCIIVIKKIEHTNSMYPRKAGVPSKKPL